MAPDEPTSAPVTISRSLLSIKPAAAAAQPEYELSIDTTTGISAPPIEATRCQPNASAISVISSSEKPCAPLLSVRTNHSSSRKETTSASRLSLWRCGSISGRDEILPRSLPNATSEPVKVTAPIKMPRKTSVR